MHASRSVARARCRFPTSTQSKGGSRRAWSPGAVLLVLADGYEPASSKWSGSVDVLEPIGLVPRATRPDRTRRGALRGVVHGIGGASLEDAVEIEYSAIADTWRDRTTAARDGSFAFDGLPLGDAFVLARSGDSFARVTVRVDGPAMPALALELRPQAEVRLQVVDALDGTDIDGVWTIDHGPAAFSDRVELVRGASVPIVVWRLRLRDATPRIGWIVGGRRSNPRGADHGSLDPVEP
jgi:hypothetical protein